MSRIEEWGNKFKNEIRDGFEYLLNNEITKWYCNNILWSALDVWYREIRLDGIDFLKDEHHAIYNELKQKLYLLSPEKIPSKRKK